MQNKIIITNENEKEILAWYEENQKLLNLYESKKYREVIAEIKKSNVIRMV